jgi:hypothetical protein
VLYVARAELKVKAAGRGRGRPLVFASDPGRLEADSVELLLTDAPLCDAMARAWQGALGP